VEILVFFYSSLSCRFPLVEQASWMVDEERHAFN
jgi:hypothetical protein